MITIIDTCIFCCSIIKIFSSNPKHLCENCKLKIIIPDNHFFVEDLKAYCFSLYNDFTCKPILTLKYNHQPFVGKNIAFCMYKYSKIDFTRYEKNSYLIPIPTTFNKLITRGYNQVNIISQYLSQYTNIPILNLLEKSDNSSQKNKNLQERKQSNKHKFVCKEKILKKINTQYKCIIIDDVITSGSTILSAYNILKPYFSEVIVLSLLASPNFFPKNQFFR